MNSIQSYQVNFQAGSKQKAARTLADKFKDKKEVNRIITNFKNTYNLSKRDIKDFFEFDVNTTPKLMRAKIKTIDKNLDALLEELNNMECVCECRGEYGNIHEGIIDIIQ